MNRSRTFSAFAAAALAASLLAGCSDSNADVEPLAEPVLDFPQTSTTPTPTPTTTKSDDDEDDKETTTSSSTTTKKSSTSSSTRTSTKSSSKRSESRSSNNSNKEAREPAPVRETIIDDRPGATCAWPTQGEASGSQEYSTFCDREWARTVTSDGQDYYWAAKGQGWVSVDPTTTDDGDICWAREDFEAAPEAIRNAVAFCDPASGDKAE